MDSKIKQKLFMDCLEPIYDKLARYTRALTRNRHDAQDLLNETLLKTFENFDKVKSADKFTGYVFTIAKRTYTRNKWRRRFFGSYNEQEAEKIEDAGTSRCDITVLHCTTEYPAPFHDVNLRAMITLRDSLGVAVGYSDHTCKTRTRKTCRNNEC